ncbi:MAG: 6-hydroxymethylpterin diphosphokinase MptE-like protein, partial [Campylobacterota bacterium]|nr:6-hydroxymethylpterin diphosphokinase MptE-like protein [Campylobacterota bacterium]
KNLYDLLGNIKETVDFEVYAIEETFDILDKKHKQIIYDKEPSKFIENKIQSFIKNYNEYPFTYSFGIGNGKYYKKLFTNKNMSRVVIIEPELQILYSALHLEDFSQEILDKRFVLFHKLTKLEANNLFDGNIQAVIFSKVYSFDVHNKYYETFYHEDILQTNLLLANAIKQRHYGLGNDPNDTLLGVKRHIGNLPKAIKSPSLKNLVQQCKNTNTAIIVSTGPSLYKQLDKLKTIEEYATIFCIDASLPILYKADIKPDMIFSIERGKMTTKLYESSSKKFQEDSICVLSSVVHPAMFKSIKSKNISLNFRNYSYMQYYELKEYLSLGLGMSPANMAYELTIKSRFDNCIFIGQDLAFSDDGKSHSEGHILGEDELQENKESVLLPRYGGEGYIPAHNAWGLFKSQLEAFVPHANKLGIKTINSTEGGARIEGTIEMSFEKSIKECVDFTKKKKKICLNYPTQEEIAKNTEMIREKNDTMLKLLIELQVKTVGLYKEVSSSASWIKNLDISVGIPQEVLDKVILLNNKIDLYKDHILEGDRSYILSEIFKTVLIRLEMEIAKVYIQPMATKNDQDIFKLNWPILHERWLFSISKIIKAMIEAVALGLIESDDDYLIKKYFTQEDIEYLYKNKNLFEFAEDL